MDYMRQGMIQLDDLADVSVLALAEFWGIDALILAVKVATHVNLHPNFSGTEEDAQEAFDDDYGSTLRKAIRSGILPEALHQKQEIGGKEYANLRFAPEEMNLDSVDIAAKELENDPDVGRRFPLLGALNLLHYHRYVLKLGKRRYS